MSDQEGTYDAMLALQASDEDSDEEESDEEDDSNSVTKGAVPSGC